VRWFVYLNAPVSRVAAVIDLGPAVVGSPDGVWSPIASGSAGFSAAAGEGGAELDAGADGRGDRPADAGRAFRGDAEHAARLGAGLAVGDACHGRGRTGVPGGDGVAQAGREA